MLSHLSVCLCVCLSVCLSVCVSMCLCVCVSDAAMSTSVESADVLNREDCLNALAAVRRIKWFHVRHSPSPLLSLSHFTSYQ